MTKRIRARASAADQSARSTRRSGASLGASSASPQPPSARTNAPARGRAGPRVLLYTRPGCAQCRQAKAFMASRGIPFSELDVFRSQKARKALERLGARGLPTILVGDKRLDGFSAEAFLRLYQQQRHRD